MLRHDQFANAALNYRKSSCTRSNQYQTGTTQSMRLGHVAIDRKVARGAGYPDPDAVQILRCNDLTPQPRPARLAVDVSLCRRTPRSALLGAKGGYHSFKAYSRVCQTESQIQQVVLVVACFWYPVIVLLILAPTSSVTCERERVWPGK